MEVTGGISRCTGNVTVSRIMLSFIGFMGIPDTVQKGIIQFRVRAGNTVKWSNSRSAGYKKKFLFFHLPLIDGEKSEWAIDLEQVTGFHPVKLPGNHTLFDFPDQNFKPGLMFITIYGVFPDLVVTRKSQCKVLSCPEFERILTETDNIAAFGKISDFQYPELLFRFQGMAFETNFTG